MISKVTIQPFHLKLFKSDNGLMKLQLEGRKIHSVNVDYFEYKVLIDAFSVGRREKWIS